jgi:cyanophycinase
MKHLKRNIAAVFLGLCTLASVLQTADAKPKSPKGHLFIVGGGKRTPEMMRRFVELAGGAENARIVVIPMASSIPDTVGMEQVQQLKELGLKDATFTLMSRGEALAESTTARFNGVTGVFFSGGDQSRLTAILNGTPVLQKIKQLYADGAVIGGTSAGAAVMTAMMITGKERLSRDTNNAYAVIRKGNIETTEGFGFIQDAIVDQHFIRRKRHNRLFSLVLEHPKFLGIGIDEATAIIMTPTRTFQVVGEGMVMVFDARKAQSIATDKNENFSAANITMHLLGAGDSFSLNTRQPIMKHTTHESKH